MQYVRSLSEGDWLEVPINVERPAEPDPHAPEPPKLVRTVVMALENGRWKVNDSENGVDVFPGLVVSFNQLIDANFLLGFESRASRVHVVPGQIVVFHNDEDADHFISLGQAERVNRKEAQKILAAETEQPVPTKVVAMDHKRAGASR
jgi:hypothetical protein